MQNTFITYYEQFKQITIYLIMVYITKLIVNVFI